VNLSRLIEEWLDDLGGALPDLPECEIEKKSSPTCASPAKNITHL
jgi:hypothetical protein